MRRNLISHPICPHCWHKFRPEEVLWISNHPDLRGDPLLSQDDQRRFLPSRFNPSGEALDERGSRCQKIACPNCHLPIPMVLLETRAKIFSIVGAPASGKSYIITCASWRMRQSMPTKFGLVFSDADPLNNTVVNSNEERLFLRENKDEYVHIEKTEMQGRQYNSVQFDPGLVTLLPHPFLFTMAPTEAHPNGSAGARLRQVLCLYDNAGEHFLPGADSAIAPGTQHLAKSRVVMFVFDPTQDVSLRALMSKESADPQLRTGERTTRQGIVLNEMIGRIRSHTGMGAGEKVEQPLIVVVSKSDAWKDLIPDEDMQSEPYVPGPRDGILVADQTRITRVSDKVKAMLTRMVPEFVSAADSAFQRVVYIPVSALGCAPSVDPATGLLRVKPSQIKPWWIDVPFIYAFARWSRVLVGKYQTPSLPLEALSLEDSEPGGSLGN